MKKSLIVLSVATAFSLVAGCSGTATAPVNNPAESGNDFSYGACAHFCKKNQLYLAEPKFLAMKPMGINWVRNGFQWRLAETAPGKWDYSGLDKAAASLKKHQMNFLPILAYDVPWSHPAWEHLDSWSEYVRRTVSRYQSQFKYWEIWNEENMDLGIDSKMTPEQYTKLLKKTAETIRSIDPNLKIVFGGTAGVPIEYIRKCLDLGAAEYFDVMNIHPYVDPKEPETLETLIQPLLTLWKERKLNKPIWVTEFSWPTHRYPVVADKIYLTEALKYFQLSPETCPVAIIRNPELEAIRQTEDFTQGVFPKRKEIAYSQIKDLNVKDFPVLVPSLTQHFPHEYFQDVVDYVKRGGIIIHSFGLPFYYDIKQGTDGHWQRFGEPDKSMMKALHIDYLTSWHDKVSKEGKVIPAPGIKPPRAQLRTDRRLSTKNLAAGDKFYPLYLQKDKDDSQPIAGVYQFNSDLKGGVIIDVVFRRKGVSLKLQGQYLPRAWILLQSMGMQKIFWYNFRASEHSPSNNGSHFGIVNKDFTLRDSTIALKFLALKMAPTGSSQPVITVNDKLYHAAWIRPDKTRIHAVWTTGKVTRKFRIPFAVKQCWNYLGAELPLPKTELTVDGEIIYLEEK